jgi:site-specific DNA-methyltransferase (adenine-specific)
MTDNTNNTDAKWVQTAVTGSSFVLHGDCLELMKDIPAGSVDMILCDLPYGTTACKWDVIIPFNKLWEQYERVIKPNGAIVLTASQPFTSALVMSNIKMFKYEWIWKKTRPSGSLDCNRKPLKDHENMLVFYKSLGTYNPQMTSTKRVVEKERVVDKGEVTYCGKTKRQFDNKGLAYPRSVKELSNPNNNSIHPTQKPVELMEYLINTYTKEGEMILDNCAGSGTTGIACINTNRNYILIEKEQKYFDIINKRIENHTNQTKLF